MFEYLMPLLFTQTHENSLLDRACHDAVRCQIAYGQQNRVPWGISESAFSALDRHNVYQYRAFGVPALALKRGQEEDLVVAPYAAALALGVEPAAAMKNLRRLASAGRLDASRRLRLLRVDRLFAAHRTRGCGRNHNPLLHGASPGDVAARLRQCSE